MINSVRIGAFAGAACLMIAVPASAAPRRGQLLRDVPPTSTAFRDRVLPRTDRQLQQAVTYRRYAAGDESVEVRIVTPAGVVSLCGGDAGVLACSDPASQTMVVPGEQISGGSGVTSSYVVAHEYVAVSLACVSSGAGPPSGSCACMSSAMAATTSSPGSRRVRRARAARRGSRRCARRGG